MLERKVKPIAVTLGTAFAAALTAGALAESDGDLFAVDELNPGYQQIADAHGEEGSCGGGEGSCGEGDEEEGSCGEDKGGEDDTDEASA